MNFGRRWCSLFHWHRRIMHMGRLSHLRCDDCRRDFSLKVSETPAETAKRLQRKVEAEARLRHPTGL